MRWPRTLFGRNLLLLIALLVLTHCVLLLSFRLFVQAPRLERLASYILEQQNTLREAFEVMPPAMRGRAIDEYCLKHPHRLLPVAAARWSSAPPTPRESLVLAPLHRMLGPEHPVRWVSGESRLWVKISMEGRPFWMGFAVRNLLPETGQALLVAALVELLLAVIGAFFLQRHLHAPLRRLAAAADAIRGGGEIDGLPLDGPQEIAQVAASFQRMEAHLRDQDRERTLMLAGVSHDLRTPLAKLKLCVEMLKSEGDADLLVTMARNIDAADRIIGQFIGFARAAGDEPEQLCDLAELVRSVVAEAGMAGQCRLVLQDPAPLAVYPVALRRAVMNLLENARAYAPGMVDLSLGETGGEVYIRLQDRGPGIPPGQWELVQQPFVRLDAARGRHPGTGLGLAIVSRIMQIHHGRMELDNREGGGLSVTLWLLRSP